MPLALGPSPGGDGPVGAWPDPDGPVDDGSVDDLRHPLARLAEQEGPGSAEPGGSAPHGGRPSWARRVALRWLPPSLAGARVDPGRPGALVLIVVVLVGAVVAGVGVWSNRPTAEPVGGLPPVAVTPAPDAVAPGGPVPGDPVAAGPATAGPLVVSVVGKVARPGLVRIPDGARVADAVDAAGGAMPGVDLAVLNLARRVGDGEQIAVGVPPAPDAASGAPAPGGEPASGAEPGSAAPGGAGAGTPGAGGTAAGNTGAGAKVDLNRATAADLDALPGVGPVTATKIIDWRTANGRFSRVEQLREVDGIGERRFATLQALVTV